MRDRILEIGSALFANTGNALFKVPTSIISVLRVDQSGNVWFFLNHPNVYMEETDRSFPARLDFYRKGKPFFLNVSGTAEVITDADMIREIAGEKAAGHTSSRVMLVKVQVEHAAYFEQRERTPNIFQQCWLAICKHLLHEQPVLRPYKIHPMELA
ncbi:pyridoxamine 5'-phosphate oxidase family protein [Paraflavitalea pollutisoli]|uniref:pyridoxamine 5'-phosphate oxidase family protein n=1 Tax=Paraflavitalea pollutisoli TaxID=3034143 RepID=UPI0023ED882E|nr:pyridoxamine 5'-phosphate oxidase family protein [Paraflavitalea sp. H1-2-19X]